MFPTIVGLYCIISLIFILIRCYYNARHASIQVTDGLPWAGLRDEMFSKARASMRQLLRSAQTLTEGYDKYSKNGQLFNVPDTSFQHQIMLPQQFIKWIIAQPDSVLNIFKVRKERNALGYLAIAEKQKATVAFLDRIVGRCLNKNLDQIQPDVHDEIRASVDETMGMEEQWHELNLHNTLKAIGDRTGARALFGSKLCRDEKFLRNLDRLIMVMGLGTLIIGQLPFLFRSVAGAFLNLPLRYYKARVMKVLVPMIQQQMQDSLRTSSEKGSKEESNDFVTQGVKVAMESKDRTFSNDARVLAEQFLLLAFAGLSTTSMVKTNVFLDILSTPVDLHVYESLREEAATVFVSESDWSDPAALKKLVLTDSAIRESLRLSPLQVRGLLREVMPEKGLTLPDGTHVTKGTWIGTPVGSTQMDDRLYEQPYVYDPFRFAKMKGGNEKVNMTQTSDRFFAWSYGRYTCPGRWFAAQWLKLTVAYITLHYDIEAMQNRPRGFVFGDSTVPPVWTRARVRRRKSIPQETAIAAT